MTPTRTMSISTTDLLAKLIKTIGADADSSANDVLVWSVKEQNLVMANLALKAGASPDATEPEDGLSVLCLASQKCDLAMMQVLLESHANPDFLSGRFGFDLPLLSVVSSKAAEPVICEAVSLLANYGADMNLSGLPDSSALVTAAICDLTSVIRTLRGYGAELTPTEQWNLHDFRALAKDVDAALKEPVEPMPRVRHVSVSVDDMRQLEIGSLVPRHSPQKSFG